MILSIQYIGLPSWLSGKESTCQWGRCGFDPWVGKILWRRKWQPTPVFLPGEFHGQRTLAGYSPLGCRSQTRLKWLSVHNIGYMHFFFCKVRVSIHIIFWKQNEFIYQPTFSDDSVLAISEYCHMHKLRLSWLPPESWKLKFISIFGRKTHECLKMRWNLVFNCI